MTSPVHSASSLPCRCGLSAVDRQRLGLFLTLVLGFAVVEWLVGSHSHSLALQSDAGHMLTDVGAIALALSASWLTRLTLAQSRPGQPHLEAIAALVNGLGLLVMAGLICLEAWHHLTVPTTTLVSGPMAGTALVGLGINGFGVWLLHGQGDESLNRQGAFLHVVADLASSVGVIIGALCMALFHWFWVDGVLSLAIALLIGSSALPLIYHSWRQIAQPQTTPPPRPDLTSLGFLETGYTDLSTLLAVTPASPGASWPNLGNKPGALGHKTAPYRSFDSNIHT
ncbi:cation transporter [Nodosilinea sp. LEGE 06152]|uniref:cation diffusion facilitator family transporter n=1 Tax=Nodosilinea sp. LEGE 06152 TaxID=2777966 RepID=UPI00188231DB|nr:cation diffusion facilitator family transporter [Nodosilinea sp. LEGE 06152]MBE9160409.1 cation transporter [Nodosilinea sp. LEGE 06152]